MKEQDVTCLSLLVSRKHCEFTIIPDGLSVMDLGVCKYISFQMLMILIMILDDTYNLLFQSSNGVFVNGKQITPMQRYVLKENDIVGIGCYNTDSLEDTMFVYRVKRSVRK